jgi:hypothetical protein
MSNITIPGPATLWFAPVGTEIPSDDESFEDAGWQSAEEWFNGTVLEIFKSEDATPEREFVFETVSVTATFAPSSEFLGILVGMQLEYNLRELHRKLDISRYLRWPYTN